MVTTEQRWWGRLSEDFAEEDPHRRRSGRTTTEHGDTSFTLPANGSGGDAAGNRSGRR